MKIALAEMKKFLWTHFDPMLPELQQPWALLNIPFHNLFFIYFKAPFFCSFSHLALGLLKGYLSLAILLPINTMLLSFIYPQYVLWMTSFILLGSVNK